MRNRVKQLCFALVVFLQSAWAVPVMRVIVPDELKNPIWVSTGTNGPSGLIFEVTNDGDGTLSPTVSGGFSPWLTPTIGGPLGCIFDFQQSCRQVRVMFTTAGLAAGTYDGEVIVSDPGAANAPQTVPIEIFVGGTCRTALICMCVRKPIIAISWSFRPRQAPRLHLAPTSRLCA